MAQPSHGDANTIYPYRHPLRCFDLIGIFGAVKAGDLIVPDLARTRFRDVDKPPGGQR
jgi:hypothetical protein